MTVYGQLLLPATFAALCLSLEKGKQGYEEALSIGETNALFVATLPYPSGARQCRIAAEAADSYYKYAKPAKALNNLYFQRIY